ncbi:hypothetical protein ACQ4WX_02945 [Streptomyces lasalocidi]
MTEMPKVVVYPPADDGGRRVRVGSRFVGMAYTLLRRRRVPEPIRCRRRRAGGRGERGLGEVAGRRAGRVGAARAVTRSSTATLSPAPDDRRCAVSPTRRQCRWAWRASM